MEANYDVIVIGAGPAGMMAAGQSALSGARTLLLEKMDFPGRKLRLTGKGRCNVTNTLSLEDFIENVNPDGRFLRPAFTQLFTKELVRFMDTIGISTVEERGGRIFPISGQAQDVVDALSQWVLSQGVSVKMRGRVSELIWEDGRDIGVRISGDNTRMVHASSVVLATGGRSYPATGSTGDGYRLAESVGHSVVPVRPALVPLEIKAAILEPLIGLKLRNVSVKGIIDGKKRFELFGEMEFTSYGITGPVVLTASRALVEVLQQNRPVAISIDCKPALNQEKLRARLDRELTQNGKKTIKTMLRKLLPEQLVPVCLEQTRVPDYKLGSEISSGECNRLLTWLKDFRLELTGHRPFDEAIVTAGGVNTREIDPYTMESKLVKGLYFAGEVLDLDGDTGGYNLQIAFSTGWLAGRSAAGYNRPV
ncbi:MAG: NAD(P)/FAD-dependent oxidoreductase [bacterium]|jgi:hypothetical protein|nr:NAD(P)/FAD-dependent oxidoreductase [bacterium]